MPSKPLLARMGFLHRFGRVTAGLCGLGLLALAIPGCGGGGGGSSGDPPAPVAFVSEPDCPGPANIIREEDAAPLGMTFMRVQNMGDPGTPEFLGEIANAVTWAVGDYTGYHPANPAAVQRGFRDAGPPTLANAYQLGCDGAGFLLNTWQFSHAVPLVGEGPNLSIARDFVPGRQVWRGTGSVFSIEADVDLRHVAYQAPHTGDGTAQLSFFYYVRDTTTNTTIAHVIGLFDSRPPTQGQFTEKVDNDSVNYFVYSPLAPVDELGQAVQYVRVGAGSAQMRTVEAWRQPLRFRAEVPHAAFTTLLARLRAGPLPTLSPRPEDYALGEFGVLGEVFPGTGDEHNVSMGASVFRLRAAGG